MDAFHNALDQTNRDCADPLELRRALLDFIADFANWDNATEERYLSVARRLTESAHVALGGEPGTRPLVVDPFAGGGAIPLEALRVGADAFASDLNPVAVLLNKVVLEYIPKYGQDLADEVRKWGEWVKVEAEKELAEFYPKDPDGATPIAYLWARTITCEGPGCGAEVPLIRSMWLAKKKNRPVALRMVPDHEAHRVEFEIMEGPDPKEVQGGTVKRGSATCPVCGYTTPVKSVRKQLKARRGGAADARLFCVVTTRPGQQGRFYRLPTERDFEAVRRAAEELERRKAVWDGDLSLVPGESLPPKGTLGFRVQGYGIDNWGDLFTPRQALTLTTLARLVQEAGGEIQEKSDDGCAEAVQTCLAIAVDRQADHENSLCRWNANGPKLQQLFGRAAVPMMWDFAEAQPFGDSVGDWLHAIDNVLIALDNASFNHNIGHTEISPATHHPLPDDSTHYFFTDPPYYDAIPYADLSDFFYVWLKRTLPPAPARMFRDDHAPKDEECIVDEVKGKDKEYFERTMEQAMAEGRRILVPNGIGTVVFANKSTAGWEAQLQAMVSAGWIITGSWPIDTEMGTRLRGMNSAALTSSVHLVCRPRENPDGKLRTDDVGDWRSVLAELPPRIREWMTRLRAENIVGADAIFACLGPALEIYSRHEHVEKVSGERVSLHEYLENVWATISREALSTIFEGADTEGFGPDARLTAMWLWTLSAGGDNATKKDNNSDDNDEEGGKKSGKMSGFALEYDTARKIAQGLGARLDEMPNLVEVKGSTARLLPVRERATTLFGRYDPTAAPKGKKEKQMTLGEVIDGEYTTTAVDDEHPLTLTGTTVLDTVHQSMLLFGAGKSDALKRFLLEDVRKNPQFATLAQALSALYPQNSEEKRWVDGVLARKKSLGL
jgi:putative DNA methylase